MGEGEFSCRMTTARHIPPPLAGVGTGGRNDRAREGANPRPRLRGRGLRAKQAGGGGIQLQDVYGQAYLFELIYFSLNNDGSVIPFCSFPNIKSHMKFLA